MTAKTALTAIAWIALATAIGLGLLWLLQRSLIYLPAQQVPSPPIGVEKVGYETSEGLACLAGIWRRRILLP